MKDVHDWPGHTGKRTEGLTDKNSQLNGRKGLQTDVIQKHKEPK